MWNGPYCECLPQPQSTAGTGTVVSATLYDQLLADRDSWRRVAERLESEKEEADTYIKELWRNGQLPAPMPISLRERLANQPV